jgi:hypothetical protein
MNEEQQRHADQQQSHTDDLWNKVMIAAVIGLLSWNLMTTQKLSVDVAVLTEKISRLEQALNP